MDANERQARLASVARQGGLFFNDTREMICEHTGINNGDKNDQERAIGKLT